MTKLNEIADLVFEYEDLEWAQSIISVIGPEYRALAAHMVAIKAHIYQLLSDGTHYADRVYDLDGGAYQFTLNDTFNSLSIHYLGAIFGKEVHAA
jgi:hypothetical protein